MSSTSPFPRTRVARLIRFPRPWAAVAAGAILGSAARSGVTHFLPWNPTGFPVATLAVNLTGSFLLGLYVARRERTVTAPYSLQFWGIGVFGSFTTFSAFSVEVVVLLDRGEAMSAGGYVVASIVGGLFLALVGQRVGSVVG